MELQWYPGHMTKADRHMKEDIRLVDVLVELLDARAPRSCCNPKIDTLAAGKGRVRLLTKSDLADAEETKRWIAALEAEGMLAKDLDARSARSLTAVRALLEKSAEEKRERDLRRGIKNRPLRVMVAGIPNVGKSTLINSLAGRSSARTGDRPGVTRGNQWISLAGQIELLDTPGLLWPKFDDSQVGVHLACIGAIRDEVFDMEALSHELIRILTSRYPDVIPGRYGIRSFEQPWDALFAIAQSRHCVKSGGAPDTARAARILVEDYRKGALGGLTLESPDLPA